MTVKKRDSIITEVEIAFAELLLKGGQTDEACAEQAGIKRGMGGQVKRRPCVLKYMEERRERWLAAIESKETSTLGKLDIGVDAILARLWAIASLQPEQTKGSVMGQVQALNSLYETLGSNETSLR